MASRIYSDSPIQGGGITPDRLNRTGFAERIAKSLILEPETESFVVSLEAPWGHGKTSTLNLIENELRKDKDNKPILFKFNPWLVGKGESLVLEFLLQFASEIGMADPADEYKKAAEELSAYAKLFSVLKFLPSESGLIAGVTEKVFKCLSKAAKMISKLKELNIEERRNKVIDAIKELKRPIVIFIDDLDRQTPEEVFEMLRAIKAISGIPRLVIVMAFERQYIVEALEKHSIKNPSQYLEKIIQVSLTLPPVNLLDLGHIIDEAFNNLTSMNLWQHFENDQKNLGTRYQMSMKPLIKSVREVKKIFNRLYFSAEQLAGEVAFTDLFCLEVLAVKAPEIHDFIVQCPDCFTKEMISPWTSEDEHSKKTLDEINKMVDKLPLNERGNITDIIRYLFPRVYVKSESSFSNTNFEKDGRVASHKKLLIALSNDIPSGNTSMIDVRAFCMGELSYSDIINTADDAIAFLDALNLNIDGISVPDIKEFISSLYAFICSEQFSEASKKPRGMFEIELMQQCYWILKKVIKGIASSRRNESFELIFSEPKFLSFSSPLLRDMLEEQGYFSDEKKVTAEYRLCQEDKKVEAYKNKWLGHLKASVNDDSFLAINNKHRILWLYWRLYKETSNEINFTQLFTKDSDFDQFVESFRLQGSDSIKGETVSAMHDVIDYIIGKDIFNERTQKRLDNGIDNNRLKALCLSILNDCSYYTVDCTKTEDD